MGRLSALFLITQAAWAQMPVAPALTSEPATGENVSNYNIAANVENGYRFLSAGGNFEQYRSSVNYGNGIRLFAGSVSITSREGHGRLFDQLTLHFQGLGNDPYQAATLSIEKNRLYRYDMSWRLNDYFNPGLVSGTGEGEHLFDTQFRTQDHTLTILPQSRATFFLGFSDSTQEGPAYSSIQPLGAGGDVFPLFSDLRLAWREYRIGNEFRILGLRVNWMRGWEDFKDDTGSVLAVSGVPGVPPQPASDSSLTAFERAAPDHGTGPFWRVALFADHGIFSMNGRFTYTAGRGAFVLNENSAGSLLNASGPATPIHQQVVTFGNAERPVATGNLNLSLEPHRTLTITNSTSFYNVRTLGDSYFSQFDNATQTSTSFSYNYLGIRTMSNDTHLNYQSSRWWGTSAGYHYSDRLIASNEVFTAPGVLSSLPASQINRLQSGTAGAWISAKGLTVTLSAEIGSASRPFTPKADGNYHALDGRIQYKHQTLRLSASANANYNANSISITSYGSQARSYSVTGDWTPRSWFSADAGFERLHLYTIGGISYFADSQLVQNASSTYISNVNSVHAGIRLTAGKRVEIYAGYARVQDVGDGRSTPAGADLQNPAPAFAAAQTFPVAFQSPQARISIAISKNVRWNAGYQYYGYREPFYTGFDFRANTGFSSLSFVF